MPRRTFLPHKHFARNVKVMFEWLPQDTGKKVLLGLLLGVLGVLLAPSLVSGRWMCQRKFSLLNHRTVCDESKERTEWDYEPLRQELAKAISEYTSSKSVPRIALYFRDLKNGPRLSFREEEQFEPASLLKVPIMMVFLHQADGNPKILDEVITYDTDYHKDFLSGESDQELQLHASYTIRELLRRMIEYSDNASGFLLMERINTLGLSDKSNALSDLGAMSLLTSGKIDNTRLISLVNIFVALYNGNYLSPESSQFGLDLLTHTNFDKGIVGGVPKNVLVAHKFGIRFGANDDYGKSTGAKNESQLHDCGIVYHPTSPYVLCVLTAGGDIDTASAAIQNISRIVYEHVDALEKE